MNIKQAHTEIERLEHNLSCILCHATDGRMSKTNYTLEAMYEVIDEVRQNDIDDLEAKNNQLTEDLENAQKGREAKP